MKEKDLVVGEAFFHISTLVSQNHFVTVSCNMH